MQKASTWKSIALLALVIGVGAWMWSTMRPPESSSAPEALDSQEGSATLEDPVEPAEALERVKVDATVSRTLTVKVVGESLVGEIRRFAVLEADRPATITAVSPFDAKAARSGAFDFDVPVEIPIQQGKFVLLELRVEDKGQELKARAIRILGPLNEDHTELVTLDSPASTLTVTIENPEACAEKEGLRVFQRPLGARQPYLLAVTRPVRGQRVLRFEGVPSGEILVLAPGAVISDRPPFVAFTILGESPVEGDRSVKLRAPGYRSLVRFTVDMSVEPGSGRPGRIFLEPVGAEGAKRIPLRTDLRTRAKVYELSLSPGDYRFGVVPRGSLLLSGPLAEQGISVGRSSVTEVEGQLLAIARKPSCRLTIRGVDSTQFPVRVLFFAEGETLSQRSLEDSYLGSYSWASATRPVHQGLGRGWVAVLGRGPCWLSRSVVELGGDRNVVDLMPACFLDLALEVDRDISAATYRIVYPGGEKSILLLPDPSGGSRSGQSEEDKRLLRTRVIVPRGKHRLELVDYEFRAARQRPRSPMERIELDATLPRLELRL
jgi:hypothetical protein